MIQRGGGKPETSKMRRFRLVLVPSPERLTRPNAVATSPVCAIVNTVWARLRSPFASKSPPVTPTPEMVHVPLNEAGVTPEIVTVSPFRSAPPV